MEQAVETHPRFVTIDYFVTEMMGYKSKVTYYNKLKTPGWPQRVYPGGPGSKPLLVYEECVAYMERLMQGRTPPTAKPPAPEGKKRHPGRPAAPAKRHQG